jgi:surface protein
MSKKYFLLNPYCFTPAFYPTFFADKCLFALMVVLAGFFPGRTMAQEPFIITVKTDNAGASNNQSFTIPTTGTGYDYEVDWDNDGIYDEKSITGNVTHFYSSPGTYTIRIRGAFPRIYFFTNGTNDNQKLIDIKQWGSIAWESMDGAFYRCKNLNISATDIPDLSRVTSMEQMFEGCAVLNGPSNIGSWNTSNVTNMHGLFRSCLKFNQPIGNWNTANVTDMSDMFGAAIAFNRPIGNWNTAAVTNMAFMFSAAERFNQPIGNWNTAAVKSMAEMFTFTNAFNQPVGNWNTAAVTDMSSMFEFTGAFNQPIGNWNTAAVTDMSSMFGSTIAFNQPIENWNTASVKSMYSMFYAADSFNQPLDKWNTASVTDMSVMFAQANAFNQSIGNWDVSNVTTMYAMFANNSVFNQAIGNWNTSAVIDMGIMFSGATAFNKPIETWNTSAVQYMDEMFSSATNFNQPLGNWKLSKVITMEGMLDSCGMDCSNYSTTLIGWNKTTNPNGIKLGAADMKFGTNAVAARDALKNIKGWVISDDVASGVEDRTIKGRLRIMDVAGHIVMEEKVLATSGTGTIQWDAHAVKPGVYFVCFETENGVTTRKMLRM